MVIIESVLLIYIIDAKKQNIIIINIFNIFIQICVKNKKNIIIINLQEILINILVKIVPEIYTEYVTENKKYVKLFASTIFEYSLWHYGRKFVVLQKKRRFIKIYRI